VVSVVRRAARPLGVAISAGGAWVAAWVLLGVWVAAGVAAVVLLAALVAGWSVVEARVFDRTRSAPRRSAPPPAWPTSSDHVAFARALTAVATAYLALCEREDDQP
jgi:hypothetical protein